MQVPNRTSCSFASQPRRNTEGGTLNHRRQDRVIKHHADSSD